MSQLPAGEREAGVGVARGESESESESESAGVGVGAPSPSPRCTWCLVAPSLSLLPSYLLDPLLLLLHSSVFGLHSVSSGPQSLPVPSFIRILMPWQQPGRTCATCDRRMPPPRPHSLTPRNNPQPAA
jgi:hypothetical protein